MRWLRLGVVSLFTLALASVLYTQVKAAETAAPAAKSAATAKTPEEMAKAALAKWKTTLKITDEQAPQFETVMTDSYQKMADAKTAAAGDKAKMKASMQTIMKERDEALGKILTPEQMKIYHEKSKEVASKAKKHMSENKPKTESTSK